MKKININGFKLNLNFEPQLSKNGKEIRLSGIAKNCQMPEKWIDKSYKNHWIYTFRYIGTETFVSFEFDYYGFFVGIVKEC
jgi:hypothetical protein